MHKQLPVQWGVTFGHDGQTKHTHKNSVRHIINNIQYDKYQQHL